MQSIDWRVLSCLRSIVTVGAAALGESFSLSTASSSIPPWFGLQSSNLRDILIGFSCGESFLLCISALILPFGWKWRLRFRNQRSDRPKKSQHQFHSLLSLAAVPFDVFLQLFFGFVTVLCGLFASSGIVSSSVPGFVIIVSGLVWLLFFQVPLLPWKFVRSSSRFPQFCTWIAVLSGLIFCFQTVSLVPEVTKSFLDSYPDSLYSYLLPYQFGFLFLQSPSTNLQPSPRVVELVGLDSCSCFFVFFLVLSFAIHTIELSFPLFSLPSPLSVPFFEMLAVVIFVLSLSPLPFSLSFFTHYSSDCFLYSL